MHMRRPSACIAYIIAGFAATVAAACYGELAVVRCSGEVVGG